MFGEAWSPMSVPDLAPDDDDDDIWLSVVICCYLLLFVVIRCYLLLSVVICCYLDNDKYRKLVVLDSVKTKFTKVIRRNNQSNFYFNQENKD